MTDQLLTSLSTSNAGRISSRPAFEEAENEQTQGSVRVVSGSGFRYVVPFPWRLHQMLEEIEKEGEASIVSWLPSGDHFQVHNPQHFVEKVIPKFFKQKSYKSFQRQLHLYGFQRETDGPNRGAYFHECFLRENRQLALEISRIKAPKRRRTTQTKPTAANNKAKSSTQTAHVPAATATATMSNSAGSIGNAASSSINNNNVNGAGLSVLDRFKPLDRKDLPRGPMRSIKPIAQVTGPGFDPVLTFRQQQRCSCPNKQQGMHHQCQKALTLVSSPSHQPQQVSSLSQRTVVEPKDDVADTYDWLIKAGVPFTAFDPAPVGISSDLYDCTDEITSLFSPNSPRYNQAESMHVPTTPTLPDTTFGFNEDASLELPQDILGDFTKAMWGL